MHIFANPVTCDTAYIGCYHDVMMVHHTISVHVAYTLFLSYCLFIYIAICVYMYVARLCKSNSCTMNHATIPN